MGPLHSEKVRRTTSDYWALRHHHGLAALSPSGAAAISNATGEMLELDTENANLKQVLGKAEVEFIPHVFNQSTTVRSAEVGLELLQDWSVAMADSMLMDLPLVLRGQESTLEPGHSRSLFGPIANKRDKRNNFVVLLQGGNYDKEDRKGYDTMIQAYARFYHSLTREERSMVHLLVHSMESYLVSADRNGDVDPPAGVLPVGLNLRLALHEHGLPPEAYTMDIKRHAFEIVAAFKLRADVCLHASKVEGFGMNVMECQAVGTPVITTNYTAMGDFTMIGKSVKHRQMIRAPNQIYEMAMPDVEGITLALRELYQQNLAMKRGDEQTLSKHREDVDKFNIWLESNCAPRIVERKFRNLLNRSFLQFQSRENARQNLARGVPPKSGAYAVARGYHLPVVDWVAPWTLVGPDNLQVLAESRLHQIAWMHLLQLDKEEGSDAPPNLALIVPATYEDGTEVPVFLPDMSGLHGDVVMLVRTFVLADLQGRVSRRSSLAQMVVQSAGSMPQLILPGMVVVDRNEGRSGGFSVGPRIGEL